MSAGGRPPFRFLLATLLLFLSLSFAVSNAGKPEPQIYKLAVRVAYGDSFKGAESFREELELQLLRELQYERCFQEAIAASAQDERGADLLLLVLIQYMEERTDYDLTIAQRDSPHATVSESRRLIARMEATIELQLRLLPESILLRERRFGNLEGYRPQLDEDPHYEVQILMIENLARTVRKFACKDAGKRLRKEIAGARAAR
jgi:hypothetical protein